MLLLLVAQDHPLRNTALVSDSEYLIAILEISNLCLAADLNTEFDLIT